MLSGDIALKNNHYYYLIKTHFSCFFIFMLLEDVAREPILLILNVRMCLGIDWCHL